MRRLLPDPPLPHIITMGQAQEAGMTADQVRQRVRSGRWTRLGHGVYRTTEKAEGQDPWTAVRAEHAERAVAEVLTHPGCLIGFASAAAVQDLPTWRAPGPQIDLIARAGGHNGRRRGVIVHRLELHENDIVSDPVPMTSASRTWLDVSRGGRLVDALVLGDAALRAGRMTPEQVARTLETTWAKRGIEVARLAAKHLDGRRETPLESASWAYFVTNRLPLPRMQVEIRTTGGRFVARVDFLWDEIGLVGECDGRLKYQAPDDLYAEKRREDEIRSEGFGMLRWGAVDLQSDRLAQTVRRFHS